MLQYKIKTQESKTQKIQKKVEKKIHHRGNTERIHSYNSEGVITIDNSTL